MLIANLLQSIDLPLVLDQNLIKTRLHDANEQAMHLLHDLSELDGQLGDLEVRLIIKTSPGSVGYPWQQNQLIDVQCAHDLL